MAQAGQGNFLGELASGPSEVLGLFLLHRLHFQLLELSISYVFLFFSPVARFATFWSCFSSSPPISFKLFFNQVGQPLGKPVPSRFHQTLFGAGLLSYG